MNVLDVPRSSRRRRMWLGTGAALGAALIAIPLTMPASASIPPPEAGWFNIGVLHTSCDGRAGHANYAPCTVQDLIQRGYQYWALGHVHTYEQVNEQPRIVFPGNLQGRNIRECGAKGAVLVRVEDGEIAETSRLLVERICWASISADLTGASNESGNACTCTVLRKTVWMANQMARFKITPTTAAVSADSAALSALFPRSFSTNGAPRKIHRKQGVNVTHVASRPPRVPASIGERPPGSRNAAMNPTN